MNVFRPHLGIVALVLGLGGFFAHFSPASAATVTWDNAGSTDWFLAGNWSPASVPVAADTVVISLGETGPIITTSGAVATEVRVGIADPA